MTTKDNLRAVAAGQATPEQARNPFDTLKRQLEGNKAEFKPILGSDSNVDKFIRVVLNACVATPDLVHADRRTLLAACMRCAQDGLLPDGREAVLNIYNTKRKGRDGREEWIQAVQYLPMVGGLVKIMYDSGDVTYVDAAAVYQEDRFVFTRGENPKLEHEPTAADNPGPVIAAYCIIKLKSGETKREVMFRRDIEAVRAVSKAKDSANGPWVKWYDQQAIKSVIKRIYKQVPKPDRLERIEASDNEALGFVNMGAGIIPGTAPALANNPSETLEPMVDLSQYEAVEREEAAAEASNAKAKPEVAEPKGPSYAELAEKIAKAASGENADLVLDSARHLPKAQYDELVKLRETTEYPA